MYPWIWLTLHSFHIKAYCAKKVHYLSNVWHNFSDWIPLVFRFLSIKIKCFCLISEWIKHANMATRGVQNEFTVDMNFSFEISFFGVRHLLEGMRYLQVSLKIIYKLFWMRDNVLLISFIINLDLSISYEFYDVVYVPFVGNYERIMCVTLFWLFLIVFGELLQHLSYFLYTGHICIGKRR